MASVSYLGVAQASLNFTLNGEAIQNNLFFHKSTTWDTEELDALGAALLDWWQDHVSGVLSSDIQIREVYCVDRGTPTGAFSLTLCETDCAGTVVTSALPNQIAAVVEFLTGHRGRAYRGRNFVGGISEASSSGGLLDDIVTGALIDAYSALNTELEALDCVHVVASASDCDPETPCIGFVTPVTAIRCSLSPGTRRSRRKSV